MFYFATKLVSYLRLLLISILIYAMHIFCKKQVFNARYVRRVQNCVGRCNANINVGVLRSCKIQNIRAKLYRIVEFRDILQLVKPIIVRCKFGIYLSYIKQVLSKLYFLYFHVFVFYMFSCNHV